MLCTAYVSAICSILLLRPGFFRERGCLHSPMVQPTSGTRRVFGACFWLRVYTALKRCPRPAHLRLTRAVGRRKKSRGTRVKVNEAWLQSSRTHNAAQMKIEITPRYFGGAECASCKVVSRARPHLRRYYVRCSPGSSRRTMSCTEPLGFRRRHCFVQACFKVSRS